MVIELKRWKERIRRAIRSGKFDSRAYEDIMNPCKCVNAELAKILNTTYTRVKVEHPEVNNPERVIIRAVRHNDPVIAGYALEILEDVVNRKYHFISRLILTA